MEGGLKRRLTMKRNMTTTIIATFAGIICLTGLVMAEQKATDEQKITNKIVTFNHFDGLRPAKLTSKPGTTVIWVNNSQFPIELLFLDKQVVLACGSPVNFFVGKDGAYESNKIPSGGTASLCFTEKGTYEYKMKSSTTFYVGRIKRGFQGTISIE